jgi:YVTN family beta-propeller protein
VPITLEATVEVPAPFGIAAVGDSVWVTTPTGAVRIDATTNAVTASVKFGSGNDEIGGIGANAAGVWVTDFDTNIVYRIDPATNTVVAQIPVGRNPEGLVATADAVWVANHRGGSVSRIDPVSNTVVATIKVGPEGPSGPQGIAVGLGSVWVGVPNLGSVVRIDAATNEIQATIPDPWPALPCGGFAISPDAVWVSSCFETPFIARIDPATNAVVATVDVGGFTGDPVLIDGTPWIPVVDHIGASNATVPGTLVHIDPATNRVDRALKVGEQFSPAGTVVAGTSLWLLDESGGGQVLRVPLAVLTAQ